MTTTLRPWNDGIVVDLEQAPNGAPSNEALSAALAQRFTRDPNGTAEDQLYAIWVAAARRMAERRTLRAIGLQTWTLVLSAFPWDYIRVPKPPLVAVTGITYVDGDGTDQTLTASPEEFHVVAPSGPTAQCGRIYPLYGESWPATRAQPGAVRVTFTCGYDVLATTPETAVPEDLIAGMLLIVGELHKQRSESFAGDERTAVPAVLRANDLWDGYRVY